MKIALVGYARSGKTTASDYLVSKHGYTKVNFKDALVREMRERLPDTLEAILQKLYDGTSIVTIDDLFRVKPPIMRGLMQNYGTEVRRGDNPQYWVEKWREAVAGIENLVTDDCRFLNEAQYVKDNGGMILRIIRTDIVGAGTHISEKEHENIVADYTVTVAPGEHAKLYAELDRIIEQSTGDASKEVKEG